MSELKWLPKKVDITSFKSTIELIEFLYTIFEKDFKNESSSIVFDGQIVSYANLLLYSRCEKFLSEHKTCNNIDYNCNECPFVDKEDIFNHITCSEQSKSFRTPGIFEIERAIRLPWIRAIIENCNEDHPSIKYYETTSKGKLRKCFWLDNQKYLVILTENENVLYLTSAYYLYNRKKSDRARLDYKKYCKKIKKDVNEIH